MLVLVIMGSINWAIGASQPGGWNIGASQAAPDIPGGIKISGDGITSFYLYVNSFQPETILSIQWEKLSDNNYVAVDRGASSDEYISEITIIGTETKINQFITEIEANRASGNNVITLSNFSNTDDQLFGMDIDYTSDITATIVGYGKRPQRTLNSWQYRFKLKAISYTLQSSPSLPTLSPEIGYSSYSDRTILKIDSYDGTFYYSDSESDTGVFDGVFELFTSDAESFKSYLCQTVRGGTMTLSLSGADYPLGPNRPTGSIDTKVLEFKEEQVNINRWRYTLKLAEVA